MTYADILSRARSLATELTAIRRDIHRHPETGFDCKRTASIAAEHLRGCGYEVKTEIGKTGVVGLLRGKTPGKTIMIRADMDAIPVKEETNKDYASTVAGCMHACGHDAHTAMALGAARILAEHKDRLSGNIKVIFQPCEEIINGGALAMIADGVLENPSVDQCISLHVNPDMETGKIGLSAGPLMASVDTLFLTIIGKSSHGAAPHLGIDAILISAQIIQALQSIVSRRIDPFESAVLSICKINGGTQHNIIADEVTLVGTIRTFNSAIRQKISKDIEQIVSCIAYSSNAQYKIKYDWGNPVLVNDESIVRSIREAGEGMFGSESIVPAVRTMGSEDFARFLETKPGCMMWLGVRNEAKGCVYPWHTNRFDIDEDALPVGAAILAGAALRLTGAKLY